ncbi:hypothetical protein, partial [Kitasatospora sp. NPDC007106]|uniref:hypothetical protein n=1 Tax=Kitasatospora sp. NPDC007106 TaxID=3156914 RepID=UPI0033E2730E
GGAPRATRSVTALRAGLGQGLGQALEHGGNVAEERLEGDAADGPAGGAGLPRRRPEWKGRLGVALYLAGGATVVLGLLGWGAVAAMDSSIGPPDNHVAKSDSRVCPATTGNNLEYADAVRHFGLSVPKDAAGLVFTANRHPLFGEDSLDLRFTTTPGDLSAFLAVSGFGSPQPHTALHLGDWHPYEPGDVAKAASGDCGLVPAVRPGMVYAEDTANGQRFLAVDASDPEHPVVWVSAMDM